MALAGNIKEFGLADIFQIVSLQQKTGELTVEGKDGKVSILLEKGLIVGTDATFRSIEERLQRSLSHSDTISKFQLKRAIETQKKTLQPLWSVLAETKAMDTEVLKTMLSQQIHETIYHILRWSDGEYRFEPKKSVEYDQKLITPINTEFLVMEGFRITDEWAEVEKVITSFQMKVRRTPGAPDVPAELSEAESKIYKLVTEEQTVQNLIDMGHIGEFDTCQTVYDLMKKNLLERIPGKIKTGAAAQARRSSVALTDLLLKGGTIVIGIALLIAVVFGLRYVPRNFSLVHRPDLRGTENVKRLVAQSQLTNLSGTVQLYFLDRRKLPGSFAELQDEGFISSNRVLIDPWGNPFSLTRGQNQVVLSSSGGEAAQGLQKMLSF